MNTIAIKKTDNSDFQSGNVVEVDYDITDGIYKVTHVLNEETLTEEIPFSEISQIKAQ